MAPWPTRVAKALDRDENSRVVVENLDQIIRWITGRPSDTTSALDLETSKLGLEPGMARTRALVIINRMMLTRQDPWQALGVRRGTDPDEVRVRYKRLMQVFHPDRGFADSDWLSDCTARLHWAHEAIRKSPASRGGFATGFGKRPRGVSKPPPWTHGARAPKTPPSRPPTSTPKPQADQPESEPQPTSATSKPSPEQTEVAGVSSGVWQFPAPGQTGTDDHREDEQYVQQQARRTTESVTAPDDGDFAQTHDVMAEDLADDSYQSDYDSVFESAIELEQNTSAASTDNQKQEQRERDGADNDAVAVDIFEQASPLAYEINQDDDEDELVAARISLSSNVDDKGTEQQDYDHAVRPEDDDAEQRLARQRIAAAKAQQVADDEAHARQEQERLLEMHRQQQAQKAQAQASIDARIRKEHERKIKLEQSRREKERRKQLKLERQLERKREKEQRKKERIQQKHRELQQQRMEDEAAEKKLKEERHRLRAEAKHRAELEVEKRRLQELDELQKQEAAAFAAQKAREAERRRRHLKAEGNRLSSISERSSGEQTSVSETTIPPWQEHVPDYPQPRRDETKDSAITGNHAVTNNTVENLPTGQAEFSAVRRRQETVDSVVETSVSKATNVEDIRTAKEKLRVVPDNGDKISASGDRLARQRRQQGRDDSFDEDIFKPDAKVRETEDNDANDDDDRGIPHEPTQHAANDDSARRPIAFAGSRKAFVAAGAVGLISLGIIASQILTRNGDDPGPATNAESVGDSQSNQALITGNVDSQTAPPASNDATPTGDSQDGATGATTQDAVAESGQAAQEEATAGEVQPATPADAADAQPDIAVAAVQTDADSAGQDEANSTTAVTTTPIQVESAEAPQPRQLDVVTDSVPPETVGEKISIPESIADKGSQGRLTTVESIAEPAIDRTPTTLAPAATGVPDQQTAAIESTDQSGVRGVNVSADPAANVQHIAEELGRRYVDGDAEAFASLFAEDATMNDWIGAAAIRDAHASLFQATTARRAFVDIGKVDDNGSSYTARGRFSKVLRYSDGTSRLSDSTISMRVIRDGDRFVIASLSY